MKKYFALAALCLALGSLAVYAFTGNALWAPLPADVPGEALARFFLLVVLHVVAIIGGGTALLDVMEEKKK